MTKRIYFAIQIPSSVSDELNQLLKEIEDQKIPLIKRSNDKYFLVTNYIGRVPEENLSKIFGDSNYTIKFIPRFDLRLGVLGGMYKRHEQSYVYLNVTQGIEDLKSLYSAISKTLNLLKLPQPNRLFPEVELAKIKKLDTNQTKEIIYKIQQFDFKETEIFTVDKIWAFEEISNRFESRFVTIRSFDLQAA